jgi:RHS repeat-associated protein
VDCPAGATCTIRAYEFDDATNRTAVHTAGADGDTCPAAPSAATWAWTYDSADRHTDTGYAADAFGRFTTVPAADTAKPLDGNLTVAYHANDLVRALTQNGRTTTYTVDVDQNRIRSWTDATGGVTTTRTHHYDGSSDNPAWTDEGTGWTRNIGGIGGDLSAIHHSATGNTFQVANLHGDVVGTGDTAGTVTAANGTTDEYGTPRDTSTIGARRYGWPDAKQRAADTPGGLILMGVRLYNPTTGRFLSVDPIAGGNANAYEYCSGDPVNCYDLDGRWGFSRKWKKRFGRAARLLGTICRWAGYMPLCAVCSAISVTTGAASAGLYGASGNWRGARKQAIGTAASAALGGFKVFGKARSAGRYFKRTRSFIRNGGASGAFSRAATRAGRGKLYKRYWGTKMYVASYGTGWSIDNWGTRRRR